MPRLERLPLHPKSALLTLYRGATQLGAPLIVAALKRRAARAKEDPVRLPERLGQASATRPAGLLFWLHGASVGESLAILPLLTALLAARPTLQVLVSTGTVTSARLLGERLPARARHQFAPVDRAAAWRSFLAHWRPQLAVLVESELWPNLILETRRRGVPTPGCRPARTTAGHRCRE
jgi:3-deoxy-D-manno-octulosonic-acid transferase